MMDRYERLERLGALHASGVLSDSEFAAEKALLLAEAIDPEPLGSDDSLESPATPPHPSRFWTRRHLWLACAAGLAATAGIALAFSVISGLPTRGVPQDVAVGVSPDTKAAGPSPDHAAAEAMIGFEDASKCRPNIALFRLVEALSRLEPGDNQPQLQVPGLSGKATPRVETVAADGQSGQGVAAQIAVSVPWDNLTITHIRVLRWPNDVSSLQLRFAEPAAQAHRLLAGRGFRLDQVDRTRKVPLENGAFVTLGVESLTDGSALTCVRAREARIPETNGAAGED